MPGPRALTGDPDFRRRANHHRRIACPRQIEALPLARSQHFLRVLQHPATGDDHVGRHGDGVVEVAVLEIELLYEVRQRVPPVHIVIYRHARIPLCDVVDIAVLRRDPRGASAELAGDRVVVTNMYADLPHGRLERLRQPDLQARVRHDVVRFESPAVRLDRDLIEQHAVRELRVPVQIGGH